MGDSDWLAAAFEEHREHLRAVAYRLLGSMSDADDAVQDTWLRVAGADTSEVANLGGWLTTVVARAGESRLALVDGAVGIIFAPAGHLRIALALTVSDAGRITAIDVIADPGRLRRLRLALPPA